jgi:hypothetical protein
VPAQALLTTSAAPVAAAVTACPSHTPADARKTLAVKLNVTCDSLDSQQPDIVSAAAAKMAAAAAAAAAGAAPLASDDRRAGVQRQQGSSNGRQYRQEQQQQEQEGYAPASDSPYPTAAEGQEATALEMDEREEDAEGNYRVYSCTVQGLAAAAAAGSGNRSSSYPLSGEAQAAAGAAGAGSAARWQLQDQSLWMQPVPSKAGRRGSLADCGIRNPSQLINTNLTGEQPASAIDLAGGDSMPAYPAETLESLAAPASLSGGRRQSLLQQEPDTPHSLVVHAPGSVSGALLTGSTPGATPPRSTNPSALNTSESCLQEEADLSPDLQELQVRSAADHRPLGTTARGVKSRQHGGSNGGGAHTRHSHCSNPDSLVSSEMSERQLELHRTGWTDDENLSLGQLRAQFNQGEPCSPVVTPRAARRSSQAAQWDEVLERQASPKPESEQT